jgi:PAS domain S-box-containing protein
MKNSTTQSESASLRQRAEKIADKRLFIKNMLPSVPEMMKLIEELEVHQVELEMQNEEVMKTRSAALQAAEKYTELYDFAPVGYLTLSKEGKIIDLNLTAAKMLGKERSRLKSSLFGFFVSNDTKPFYNLFLGLVFSNKTKETCGMTLLIHSDLPMYVEITGIVNENGDQCFVTIVDITQRKKAEEAQAISEKRYRRLFETAKDGIIILDAKTGKITDVNPFLSELLGYTEEQLLERTIWEIGFFKDKATNHDKFTELQKNGFVRYEDLPLETRDGRQINVEFVSNVYMVDKKKVIQCNIRDITKRKHTEEMLMDSETRYRRLFESAKDGILILDAETGKIKDVNPFLINLMGYSKEQILEKAVWEIGSFKDIVANHDKFIELQQKKFVRYEDLPIESSKGQKINVEFVSNVYLVDNKRVIQCNIRDITERKRLQDSIKASQAKLKELNITKDKFFSIISHDLKSPFNGILGFSDMLKEDAKDMDVSTIQEFADMINRSALQVFHLLEGLLSWARIQQGQMPYSPTIMALKGVVNDTIKLLKEEAASKKIKIINHLPNDLMVKADRDMLKTILRNLISNGIKFTSTYGVVEINAVEDNGQVEVTVKDTGKGMNKEILDKLFKIEIVYSTRGTKEEAGTGMGLILCKEFVEKHGGKIWAESELAKGSEFKFTLPK